MTSSEPTGISRIPLSGRPDLCAAIIGEFKSTRYFLGVPDAMLEAMLKTAHLVRLPPGHVLISEGAGNADVFYFLLSGSVGLESGGKYLYSINNAGESVGELAVITQTPRSADVITEQVTKVVEIQWRVIQDLERADPRSSNSFFRVMTAFLAEKLHITTQRVHLYEAFVLEVMERERQKDAQATELLLKYDELEKSNTILKNLATRDQMTNLYNHSEFLDQLRRQIKLYQRNPQPFSLVIADLDDFKRVNDTWGHLVGDAVIRNAADVLVRSLRDEVDTVYRQGGEEFAVIMRNTPEPAAGMVMDRVRGTLATSTVPADGQALSTTMSLGVGAYHTGWEMEEFIHRVDKAMYSAKLAGKNRVMRLTQMPGDAALPQPS